MNKKIIRLLISVIIVCSVLALLQRLLVPKYVDGVVEGAFIAEYYRQKDKNFDVIFVGDCEVYENFSPVKLWEEYGINSYIRGSGEQYIFQSYYLMEDTFRYHIPQVVIFNIQSLCLEEAQSEAYNRMTLEGMKWSKSKINAIMASMRPEEHFIEYVFPILRYHSRWSQLTSDDFKYLFSSKKVSHNGYYMRTDVKAAENLPTKRELSDYSFSKRSWEYLDKMTKLCKDNNVQLILIKAPSLYPFWYDEWDEQVKEYAKNNELRYINFLDIGDETGIDYDHDTYDGGLHMNLSGAEKLSLYIGNVLSSEYNVPDRRSDQKLAEIWNKNIIDYENEINYQKELYGLD